MMDREFYICDDKLFCITDGLSSEITEKDTELINEILERIETYYPSALKALNEVYVKSSRNLGYFKFLRVKRFLKCNFGDLDTSHSDYENGMFHFERIHCPLRGECKFEDVICNPKFSTRLSSAEKRVMKLYYDYDNILDIADKLYLSAHTVKNHIKSSYAKLGIHSRAEFVKYVERHNLFG
ncbi:MAG: helix-turn-helix transcriptional regulator [Bacteroidales bacterium]|nr:helix-turn-helix transcriptional regulator [Bacteroidales bacterium]